MKNKYFMLHLLRSGRNENKVNDHGRDDEHEKPH